jgi:hypothetical protein
MKLNFWVLALSLFPFAFAQTEHFYRDTIEGQYIYAMLKHASYERMSCNDDLLEMALMPQTEDYLCIEDTDAVYFDNDVESYLESNPDEIASTEPWNFLGDGLMLGVVHFVHGYELYILTNGEIALLQGYRK